MPERMSAERRRTRPMPYSHQFIHRGRNTPVSGEPGGLDLHICSNKHPRIALRCTNGRVVLGAGNGNDGGRSEPSVVSGTLAHWEGTPHMRIKHALVSGGISLTALALVAGVALNSGASPVVAAAAESAEGKTFQVDPVHASVVFKIKHLNASNFYGTLNDISGSFTLGDTLSTAVVVKADSVESRNPKRNDHIKSPDFFSAKEFPEMKFVAKDLKSSGADAWKGSGDLTFRGVTKSIEVEIKKTGGGPGMGGKGEVAGIETTFTFKRSDFGSKGLIGPLSDEVTVTVALEGGSK